MKLYVEKKTKDRVVLDFVRDEDFAAAKEARGETVAEGEYTPSELFVSPQAIEAAGLAPIRCADATDVQDEIVMGWIAKGKPSKYATVWLEVE